MKQKRSPRERADLSILGADFARLMSDAASRRSDRRWPERTSTRRLDAKTITSLHS